MTPPLVLQRRISRKNAMKMKKRSLVNADQRSGFSLVHFQHDTEDDAAQLLLSMSNIVTNEIKNDSHAFDEEGDKYHHDAVHEVSSLPVPDNDQENVFVHPQEEYANDSFSWKRARTVSIDSPQHNGLLPIPLPGEEDEEPPTLAALGLPSLISPSSTPIGRGRPLRRASLKLSQKAKREHLKLPKLPQLPPVNSDIKQYKKRAMKVAQEKKLAIKQIGRKKFSWKNYPELEAFLIANREEYLRHSALNYTVQQKVYNNKLTEQLLEIASEHGYIFDEAEFNFVTVRDRIRCYFKSYVQSAKKRGITVGYAARKAGLLTEDDLCVEQEGRIVVPDNNI